VTEGVVKLDDPIEKYPGRKAWFKESPYGKDITLKMLLNHTAGMSDWYPNLPKDMTRAQLLELLDPRRPRIEVLRYSQEGIALQAGDPRRDQLPTGLADIVIGMLTTAEPH